MARSLNRVQLIGNLTRDPELRYTPAGNAVCTFGLATNRSWTTDAGEKREEVDFHRIVAWNKLAELCSQFLVKGRKVYVEGRLSTRNWTAQDGSQKSTTEVVIDDMILLDKQGGSAGAAEHSGSEESFDPEELGAAEKPKRPAAKHEEAPPSTNKDDEVAPDDIPF
jgi:single-strand DNA-binding protein